MTLLDIIEGCERLERIVAETRNSFERTDYRKRRAAALKGLSK